MFSIKVRVYLILFFLVTVLTSLNHANTRIFHCDPSLPLTNGWEYCWVNENNDFQENTVLSNINWKKGSPEHTTNEAGKDKKLLLRIRLPEGDWEQPAIYIDGGIRDEMDVWLGDTLIYEYPELWFSVWHIISLPQDYESKYLTFQFIPSTKQTGFYQEVYIGDTRCLLRIMIMSSLDSAILGFLSIILGIIAFTLFIIRKNKREFAYLSLSLFILLMGFYMISKSHVRIIVIDDPTFWFYVELISLYAIPGAACWFFMHIFGKAKHNFTLWFTRFLFILFGISVLFEVTGLVSIYNMLIVFQIVMFLEIGYLVGIGIHYSAKGNVEAKMFTFGIIVLGIFSIYNILSAMQILIHPKSTVYWGFFALEVSFAFILFRRFALLHQKLQSYSEELEDMNKYLTDTHKKLEESHEHLEDLVHQRTVELSLANEELALHNHNMIKQIKMAQRIQQHLIPDLDQCPHPHNIAFGSKYLAVETIGGDLYDVIRAGNNCLGVLMADVSGHGISAALITSMVKVAFNSRTHSHKTSSQIIAEVNEHIYEFIGDLEYFLTAYYGIIDLETGIFHYCSAGHFPALLFDPDNEEILELKTRGMIMGTLLNAKFETQSVQLTEGQRILLYTDGIVEARNKHDEYYEMSKLREYIFDNKNLPIQEFVDGLIADVDKFSEGFPSEDDRAVLCFEYKQQKK